MPWRTSDAPSSELPLLGERPAAEDQPVAAPHRHVVLGRERHYGRRRSRDRWRIAEELGALALAWQST